MPDEELEPGSVEELFSIAEQIRKRYHEQMSGTLADTRMSLEVALKIAAYQQQTIAIYTAAELAAGDAEELRTLIGEFRR